MQTATTTNTIPQHKSVDYGSKIAENAEIHGADFFRFFGQRCLLAIMVVTDLHNLATTLPDTVKQPVHTSAHSHLSHQVLENR